MTQIRGAVNIFRALTAAIACTLIVSCGFHLRGQVDLPKGVEPIFIGGIGSNAPLAVELRNLLTASGVSLTNDATKANHLLVIIKQQQDKRTASLGAGARAAEYQLIESVVFELRDHQGKLIAGPEKLTERRILPNDPNSALSSGEEENLLRREMLTNLATKVAEQLQSFNYNATPANH